MEREATKPMDGSESALAKVTLAQFIATGDGAFLDNAQADTLREMIRVLIEAAAVARARRAAALSAARPSSPTPEGARDEAERLARWLHADSGNRLAYDDIIEAGRSVYRHKAREALKAIRSAPSHATPGDDATTKEGR